VSPVKYEKGFYIPEDDILQQNTEFIFASTKTLIVHCLLSSLHRSKISSEMDIEQCQNRCPFLKIRGHISRLKIGWQNCLLYKVKIIFTLCHEGRSLGRYSSLADYRPRNLFCLCHEDVCGSGLIAPPS
jgi:hypothetical protein